MGSRATEIRKGQVLEHNDDLFVITEYEHRTPGNLRGFVQVKMRNMRTGSHITERFASNQSVETAWLDTRKAILSVIVSA